MLLFLRAALFLILLSSCKSQLSTTQQSEQTLLTTLLTGYNKQIRPSVTVNINATVAVKQIISLDEKNQILSTSNYISQEWNDPRLKWTPSAYSNIDVIMMQAKSIWIPDTTVLNSADTDSYFRLSDYSLASVRNDGNVYLIIPMILMRTRCKLNMRAFPFDKQECNVILSPWSNGIARISFAVTEDLVDLSDYLEHPIWDLYSVGLDEKQSGIDRVPYVANSFSAEIIISYSLKRKPLYYFVNFIFPCLVLNFVSLFAYSIPINGQIGLSKIDFFFIFHSKHLNFEYDAILKFKA